MAARSQQANSMYWLMSAEPTKSVCRRGLLCPDMSRMLKQLGLNTEYYLYQHDYACSPYYSSLPRRIEGIMQVIHNDARIPHQTLWTGAVQYSWRTPGRDVLTKTEPDKHLKTKVLLYTQSVKLTQQCQFIKGRQTEVKNGNMPS